MSFRIVMTGLGATTLSLSLTPAFAQNTAHQMPGIAQGSAGSAATCAQSSQGVTKAIDAVNGRIEDARQSNDPGTLRAAVSDVQVALAQIKTQLSDCVALGGDGGAAMGNMPGMDHSKVSGMEPAKPQPAPPAAAPPSKAAASIGVVVALRTQPAPPRSGNNDFEVTIKDAAGKPIADAAVSLALYMAPMPSMNMPATRSTVTLTAMGNGSYKGTGTIAMAGDWDVTLTASRKGDELLSKMMKLAVK